MNWLCSTSSTNTRSMPLAPQSQCTVYCDHLFLKMRQRERTRQRSVSHQQRKVAERRCRSQKPCHWVGWWSPSYDRKPDVSNEILPLRCVQWANYPAYSFPLKTVTFKILSILFFMKSFLHFLYYYSDSCTALPWNNVKALFLSLIKTWDILIICSLAAWELESS